MALLTSIFLAVVLCAWLISTVAYLQRNAFNRCIALLEEDSKDTKLRLASIELRLDDDEGIV